MIFIHIKYFLLYIKIKYLLYHTTMDTSIKPIDAVNNNLRSITNILNEVKIDIVCIKSDVILIKQYLDEIKKNEIKNKTELSKGWFFS
tara:strand:- start:1346 stop:1609 length:264 start_codon:yes stop_codon:yes gene_type:complete